MEDNDLKQIRDAFCRGCFFILSAMEDAICESYEPGDVLSPYDIEYLEMSTSNFKFVAENVKDKMIETFKRTCDVEIEEIVSQEAYASIVDVLAKTNIKSIDLFFEVMYDMCNANDFSFPIETFEDDEFCEAIDRVIIPLVDSAIDNIKNILNKDAKE